MPVVPINLPPGLYKNGTPYDARGRWAEANLVRWHDGSLRPIGGWSRRQQAAGAGDIDILIDTPADEAVRDIFAWRANNQDLNAVFGSNLALYHIDLTGTVTDITYSGYTPENSSKDAQVSAGYGQNPYGIGSYGVANNLIGTDPIPPDRWYFGNFGEVLITGVRGNGGMYELDLSTLTLSQVSNAPDSVQDVCVTDQRQVFAVGANDEPRRVQTSDVEDRTVWTPAVDNQCVDRVITGTGKLLRCINVLRQILILGENDAHVARYIGPPYVFSIDLAGENCGPLAAEAVTRTDRFAVWWGERNFWLYDGSVQVLDCEVTDFLYSDIDENQVSKICAFTNTDYSEIWWLYQSTSTETTEVDSYVVWNYRTNIWNVGRINRTAGIDKGVFLNNVMVDSDGRVFNHELADVLPENEGAVYARTGPIEIGSGEKNLALRWLYPATEGTGGVEYRFYARQLPNAPEYDFGPYTYQSNDPIPTTGLMGRQISMRVDFTAPEAEVGQHRFDIAAVGTGAR